MSKTSLVRATSAAIVLGAGVTLAPLALAAPASAQSICAPGSAAYPPGSCTVNITFNINVMFSGNEIVLVFGNPPGLTVGFSDQFFFFFGSKPVTPVSTGTNGQGQHTATFPAGSVPSGAQTVTVRSNTGAAGRAQLPSGGASSAQFASVPNSNAVAHDAVSGTGTNSSSGTSFPSGTSFSSSPSSIDTGQPGASSGPNAALIGGGAALVIVALGGGVFMARRRHES
jgi:hypothetical protein